MEEKNIYDWTGFEQGLEELGISLNETQSQQFQDYYELLTEWNSFMNLTAITEFSQVVAKHFLDSLSLVRAVKAETLRETLIDVGTGAGFPGIPLKIAFPELDICLLDSLGKRVKFLQAAIDKLGLEKIKAVHGRAEDYGKHPDYREAFDFCVSRAVANLNLLGEYCLPFVKTGGRFISYKSGNVKEELKGAEQALKLLGGKPEETQFFTLSGTDMERSLVCIKKIKPTPKKYPRKAGIPAREPLV